MKRSLKPQISHFAKHAAKTVGARHLNDEICKGEGNCGGETKFELPVLAEDGTIAGFKRTEPATVCVIDDMAYLFPRYGGDDWAATIYDQDDEEA